MLFPAGMSTWAVKSLSKVDFLGLKSEQGESSELRKGYEILVTGCTHLQDNYIIAKKVSSRKCRRTPSPSVTLATRNFLFSFLKSIPALRIHFCHLG